MSLIFYWSLIFQYIYLVTRNIIFHVIENKQLYVIKNGKFIAI